MAEEQDIVTIFAPQAIGTASDYLMPNQTPAREIGYQPIHNAEEFYR